MEDRIEERVRKLLERFNEVENLLGQSDILADKTQYRSLAQEHARLSEIKEVWQAVQSLTKQLGESRLLTKEETDPSFLEMVQQEIVVLERDLQIKKKQLESLLIPPDPRDDRNVILELRAGTGGDEAAIFVGDCARMYKYYAESKGWKYELLSCTPSELGGFKEHIMVLSGKGVHRLMQYEAGGHRVQRVPDTETQGRVHTSAITVAVLMEPDEKEQITLDERDLKIDTYRSSGAGGQHVNTTDSAVRITHIPTGTVVYCQEERSQHKNKDKAMRLLTAKIVEEQRKKEEREMATLRATQVGSGDRSDRIRTYNFSQNRITDHRIDLTLYKLDRVMEGDLEEITSALVAHFYELKLSSAS